MIEIWLTTPFEGGRHARRIDKITELEHEVEAEREKKEPSNASRDAASVVLLATAFCGILAQKSRIGRLQHPCNKDLTLLYVSCPMEFARWG